MLTDLIAKYHEAETAFRAACAAEPGRDHDDLWNAKEDAEMAVIRHQCSSLEDVRAKARLALSDANVYDSLRNCFIDERDVLVIFLRSVLGDPPVDKSNNGDKA